MDYQIDYTGLFELVNEEVSRIANEAYDQDGNSLYDGIRITSADVDIITRLERDAVNALIKRTQDICTPVSGRTYEAEDGTPVVELPKLEFDVPDFDLFFEEAVNDEITRYITLNVVAAWSQSRCPAKVEEYTNRGQVAMDKAVHLLKAIKAPRRV